VTWTSPTKASDLSHSPGSFLNIFFNQTHLNARDYSQSRTAGKVLQPWNPQKIATRVRRPDSVTFAGFVTISRLGNNFGIDRTMLCRDILVVCINGRVPPVGRTKLVLSAILSARARVSQRWDIYARRDSQHYRWMLNICSLPLHSPSDHTLDFIQCIITKIGKRLAPLTLRQNGSPCHRETAGTLRYCQRERHKTSLSRRRITIF